MVGRAKGIRARKPKRHPPLGVDCLGIETNSCGRPRRGRPRNGDSRATFFTINHSTRSTRGPSGCTAEETMNRRTWVRVLIAIAFAFTGLVETLSATGLVMQLSPDGRWGPGIHTLAVGGPLQLIGAALLAFGRKTRWVLGILGCYVLLASVFGNLPLIFNTEVGGSAIAGLLSNLAVIGGVVYWFHSERKSDTHKAKPALPMTNPAPALPVRYLVCQASSGPQTPIPVRATRHTAAPPRRFCSSQPIVHVWKNGKRLWCARPGRPPASQSGKSVSTPRTAWCKGRA